MIRKAKPQDIPAIVDLAVESVKKNWAGHPMKPDPEAMKEWLEIGLNPAHYLFVAEIDGEIVGAAGAFVSRSFWYKGLDCAVMLHYSRKHGQWVRLIKHLSEWMKSRSGIKMASIVLEEQLDEPKYINFLNRLGFSLTTSAVTYVRPA